MPSGVEHPDGTLRIYSEWGVPSPVMPSGVEHTLMDEDDDNYASIVPSPVMPSGVEHGEQLSRACQVEAASAEPSDAVRR